MNYETVVTDLFKRFPKLQSVYDVKFAYMGNESPGAYIVFGSVLMPALEEALAVGDLGTILPICAFLEDVAEAAQRDIGLESLLQVEVGEWLGGTSKRNSPRAVAWSGNKANLRVCTGARDSTNRLENRTETEKLQKPYLLINEEAWHQMTLPRQNAALIYRCEDAAG
jgi:hypothetical protein